MGKFVSRTSVDGEVSVNVGHCSHAFAFNGYRSACDRLAIGVGNDTRRVVCCCTALVARGVWVAAACACCRAKVPDRAAKAALR